MSFLGRADLTRAALAVLCLGTVVGAAALPSRAFGATSVRSIMNDSVLSTSAAASSTTRYVGGAVSS
jgi:hypothetical protein